MPKFQKSFNCLFSCFKKSEAEITEKQKSPSIDAKTPISQPILDKGAGDALSGSPFQLEGIDDGEEEIPNTGIMDLPCEVL